MTWVHRRVDRMELYRVAATLVGSKSGKWVAFWLRSQDYKQCSFHESKGESMPIHQCWRNWHDSSKSLEPDVARCLVLDKDNRYMNVYVVIMDDDASTMVKIQETVSHFVNRWSDINHKTRKTWRKPVVQFTDKNSLTTQVKKYFQKWFSKAVMQNKCDPYALARSLNLTVPNSFGKQSLSNYSNCFPSFDYHESAVRSGWFSQSTVTHIQTWDVFLC